MAIRRGGTPRPTGFCGVAGRAACPHAVGGAVGWNPICIVIPCHRVIGADGSLTGYGGGMGNKASLLAHEGG